MGRWFFAARRHLTAGTQHRLTTGERPLHWETRSCEPGIAWQTRGVAVTVRQARSDDLPRLGDIERAAGTAFRELGMDAVADDEPPTLAVLSGYQHDGRCWVAVDDADVPVAYAIADVVDGAAHVEQVSVHPRWARQRIGKRLIDTVEGWAESERLTSVTLTTFAEVPWNRPFYQRLGFQEVETADQSAGLRRIRAQEAAHGLDSWPRVAMRRAVGQRRRPG